MFVVELNLSRTEVAVVLDALRLTSLIGMPADSFPLRAIHREDLLASGIKELSAKKLASRSSDGTVSLDSDLVAMVKVAADAGQAAVIVKDIPGTGCQLFVHAAFNNAVVEHTRPSEGTHRFAVLQSQKELPLRWGQILAVPARSSEASIRCDLSTFEQSTKLVNRGEIGAAQQLLLPYGNPGHVITLVNAMVKPAYSANIAMLWREAGKIMDARNPMLLVGNGAAWLIHQVTAGASALDIRRVNQMDAISFLVDQWQDVARTG